MEEKRILTIRDLFKKHSYDEMYCGVNDELWHYTSAVGLVGIVRDKPEEYGKLHFWFTRSDCLNDTSEGIYILDEYKRICESLFKKKEINEEFYDGIKDIEIPAHAFVLFPTCPNDDCVSDGVLDCVPCHTFICSFSLKEDSLDMWRYYSKGNGGYGIKTRPFSFKKHVDYGISSFNKDAVFSCLKAYKVIYNKNEQDRILTSLILDSYNVYSCGEKLDELVKFIRSTLKQLQFQFKNECFETEQEYRFVFYLPYNKPELLENKLPDVKYRVQDGVVVPYLDIEIKENAYIEEVLISPFIENDSVLSTTSEYLTQCGFDCLVKRSRLPVRN